MTLQMTIIMKRGGDYDYNEPENFHMAEEPDSYDYPDNNDEDPNGLNPYFNGHAYNGEDEHFADDSVNEMNVKKTKKPKHLLKKTLKRKKAEQFRNTNPYQHSQETHSDHHTEQKLMKQKHSHKDHQQQRKVEQVQPKHKPNQQPQPKQNLQQKQNPHQNKQPTQGRQAQQKQQTQQSHQPTQSQQAQQSHQPTQSQQAQQSHQPTQSQQTQQSHQPTQSQQTQQSHQPTQSQQTQQSHQPTQSQQAQQSQQKQHSQQSQQPQVHQSEQKQLIESSMVHQQQQENDQQQHSQATSSNLQQNQQSSQQQNGIEENNIDSKDNKKTDEVEIVLSDISDSDPNINNILNSETFRNVRKQQIKDYIKSHFANQPLQEGMLVSIDDLITSNLVKGLKDKDSRLNRILRESANVMDGNNTPDEVTEDTVDSDTNKEDHVENIPETPAIPVESSVESTIKPTPLSQTISKEQEPQPKPPATKSIEIVDDSNENQVELHSKDDLVSKTVEETVDEHQIKRKNLMKNAMRGMHGNSHHHEHVHASDNHKHDHKVDEASVSSDQTQENSKDDGHDIKTLRSEDVDSSSETHKENIKESEELLDLNEKQLESETLATEEKSSQGEHQGINLPEQQSEKDSEESVEPAVENKSSEEASEKSGFLGGIFDYFSGEASEKASDVATHDGLDKTLDKTTGDEPINEPANNEAPINEPVINETPINEPVINEGPINEPVINEPAINKPNVNELDIKKADVKEPISGEPSIHEPSVKEESLVNEEKSNQEENTSPKETPETSPTINEINDIRPSQLPSDFNEKKTEDEVFKPDDDDGKGDKNQEFLKEVKESVDMEHEKHKYTKEGQFRAQSQEIDKQSEANEDSSHSKEPKNPTTRDDPLYKLCEQHPTLQACKKINENTNQEQLAVNEAPKTLSSAGHIKAFTRWINSWIYFFFLYIFSCFKTMIIFMWTYSCGMFLSLIGQHEISQLVLNSINEMSIEKFAFILVFIVNHIIFYWYFKNSNMGPVVKVIRHSGQTKVVDNSKVDELQNDIKTLNETITKLEKDLQQESENNREVEEQISKLKEEKEKLSSELIELKNKLNEAEGEKEKVRELQDQIKQYKDVIEKLETELRISNTTLDSTKEDLDTMKTDYKQLDDKFVYVIKELDTKDVAIGKMEENEKKVKEELEEQRRICKERDDTISEQNSRIDSLLEEKQNSESALEDSNKRCHEYQLEIEVLQECLLAVNKVSVDHETSNEFDNVEDDQEIDAEQLKAERLAKIMDATKAQAELKDIKDQYELCQEELKKYCDIANDSEAKYNDIWSKFEELSTEASELRKSLEKKDIELSTISKFFADRENDYQKAGMSQAEEIKILQKQIDSIGDNDKQINILLKQAQDLKEEIQTNEKQYKQQLSTVEEQSHNNYIKMRTAIRECEEHKREKEVYRKRLLDIDMTPKFKTAVKTSTPVSSKTPSERAASPTNSNKSVEENSRTESPRPSFPPAQPYGPRMYPGMPPPFSPRPPPPFGMPPMMGPYGVPPPRPYMPPPMNPARLPGSPAVSLANQPLRPRDQRPNASVMMHPHMASPLRPPPPHPLSQVRGMYPTPPHGTSPFSMPPRPPMADRTPHSNADGNQVINPENAGV